MAKFAAANEPTAIFIYIYIWRAFDLSGAYIFGKNCIIFLVLKRKWPPKQGHKNIKNTQFLEKGFPGQNDSSKSTKKEELGHLSM